MRDKLVITRFTQFMSAWLLVALLVPAVALAQPAPTAGFPGAGSNGNSGSASNSNTGGSVASASSGRNTGAPDLSEDSRQKSLAYFRMKVAPATSEVLTEDQLQRIERSVRSQVESLGRFEMVQLPFATESVKEFIQQLQIYLSEHTEDIARMRQEDRGEDYEFKYGETLITGDAIRQVLNSGYCYEIDLGAISLRKAEEMYPHRFFRLEIATTATVQVPPGRRLPQKLTFDARTGNVLFISLEPMTGEELKRYLMVMDIDVDAPTYKPENETPQQQAWHAMMQDLHDRSATEKPVERVEQRMGEYYVASMPIAIRFYRINVVDSENNIVPAPQAVTPVAQGTLAVQMSGRQTGEYLIKEDTQTWLELMIMNKRAIAAVRAEAKRRDEAGRKMAINNAAANTPAGIGTWIRTVPEFKIRAMLTDIKDGKVFQKPGRKEGLRIDDYSQIYQPTKSNTKLHIGWGLVTKLGPGFVANGDGSSRADLDLTESTIRSGNPTRGDMVEEFAMFGVVIDLGIGGEFLLGSKESDDIGGDTLEAKSGMFVISLHPGFNLGRNFELSQFWIGLDLRIGFGSEILNYAVGLQLNKKFVLGQFAFDIGVSAGITGFSISGGLQAVANHLFNEGAVGSQAQADQEVADNPLNSPILFYVAVMPRIQIFFSPNFRLFLQANVQYSTAAAQATLGSHTFDGDDVRFIPGFKWQPFGLGAVFGASFEF